MKNLPREKYKIFETFENLKGFLILQISEKILKNGAITRLPEPNLSSDIEPRGRVSGILAAHYEVNTRDIASRAHLTTLHGGDFEDFLPP